jgi:hypothetical protein
MSLFENRKHEGDWRGNLNMGLSRDIIESGYVREEDSGLRSDGRGEWGRMVSQNVWGSE